MFGTQAVLLQLQQGFGQVHKPALETWVSAGTDLLKV